MPQQVQTKLQLRKQRRKLKLAAAIMAIHALLEHEDENADLTDAEVATQLAGYLIDAADALIDNHVPVREHG